jgi:hypothetical protein
MSYAISRNQVQLSEYAADPQGDPVLIAVDDAGLLSKSTYDHCRDGRREKALFSHQDAQFHSFSALEVVQRCTFSPWWADDGRFRLEVCLWCTLADRRWNVTSSSPPWEHREVGTMESTS